MLASPDHYIQHKGCGEVVDKYVEYDTMLVVIDLIIHNISAYRHLLYNMKIQVRIVATLVSHLPRYLIQAHFSEGQTEGYKKVSHVRLAVIFLFCDAYDKWISGRSGVYNIYDLEWIFYKSLLQSCIEMGTYIGLILLCEIMFFSRSSKRISTIIEGTIIGYYGNVAVVFSIIFRLSNEFSYRFVTQFFIFISHIQVQRTLFPELSAAVNCVVVTCAVVASMASRLLCRHYLEY